MKQTINKSDWDKIDGSEQDIWLDTFYDQHPREARNSDFMLNVLTMPNIGQMIEFLERDYTVTCIQWADKYMHWRVGLDWESSSNFYYIVEQKELADALWSAVKETLRL